MAIMEKIQQFIMKKFMYVIFEKENSLSERDGYVKFNEESPVRYEIMIEGEKYGKRTGFGPRVAPIMASVIRNQNKVLNTLKKNPQNPRIEINDEELKELERLAKKHGAGVIGYTKISEQLVFKNKAVLHPNAIVLSFEMQKDKIDTAPSVKCLHEVLRTYDDLGIVSNKIAKFLRRKGFSAHAGHPLMGAALYPPMAQSAGIAWLGYSGIMISPEFGPRFRLAAVFTSIENFPEAEVNEQSWISDYCNKCRKCIKECPGNAILDQAIEHPNGRITHVENTKCMPHFINEYGCSICIKVCPFNNIDYYKLKENFEKKFETY
ncbi:MAG: epoxyqueuosine reductase [Asgard group archaeon]|nr:epoxyqueuosine reductase [Asgard group archaeon]